ncbi:hypothetical protein HGRIS_012511 [Hohenbuehelia grisea]|uniref:Endonuclease/exonuclease/phosphatase n=1 Tax=Hohenbuehelia grisea TaxID=104357 RepID=A0ABR3ISQ1_9AGAR
MAGTEKPLAVNATFAQKFAVPDEQLKDFKMIDVLEKTPRQRVSSNFVTYTGFTAPTETSEWMRIDFVFGSSNMGWTSTAYKVPSSLGDDGILASDHRPVFADITL